MFFITADNSGHLKPTIDVISNLNKGQAFFDSSLYVVSETSNTQLALAINYVYNQPLVSEKLKQNHFRLCDDLLALYITNPELFDVNNVMDKIKVRYNQDFNIQGVREAICDMMKGTYVMGNCLNF